MGTSGNPGRPTIFGVRPLIFLTIGTHEPFARLVRSVDEWYGQSNVSMKLFGQITEKGAAEYSPKNFEATDRLTPLEYANLFEQADLIVSHAGMGSILTALSSGKPIVVMPRRGHLRETRNDHQYTTAQYLGDRSGIFVAKDEHDVAAVLDKAVASLSDENVSKLSNFAEPKFTESLREFILNSKS
ncbi:hypothetical protein MUY35_15035 [Aliiroseovarius sp. S1339]|uniref:glycosyltransferase n=1 Tax=Aliiroseovarius sp. S1339 TaxID=2936990 RepID=UPI0020BF183C|nr:glycosyltransferase [Aliiroseovarius sp. S1339]MCK8465172.1 hypothetical protein [Aliiroseovarius sp. S1339]